MLTFLRLGHEGMKGELIEGRVVTAFASISSALIRDPASGERPTVFTCADDKAARSAVIALAKEIGFDGVDAGHLGASRSVEKLGLLVGQLAYGSGFGNRVTLRAYVASTATKPNVKEHGNA